MLLIMATKRKAKDEPLYANVEPQATQNQGPSQNPDMESSGYIDMTGRPKCPGCQRILNCTCKKPPRCSTKPENFYVDMDEMRKENKGRNEDAKAKLRATPSNTVHLYDDIRDNAGTTNVTPSQRSRCCISQ